MSNVNLKTNSFTVRKQKTGNRKFECIKFKTDKEKEQKNKSSASGKDIKNKQSQKEEEDTTDAMFFARAHVAEKNLSEGEQV